MMAATSLITLITLALTSLATPVPIPVPIFGIGNSESKAATTAISEGVINATLVRPAQFARLAYCSADAVTKLDCGGPCDAVKGLEVLAADGNDEQVPGFFIGHDPVTQSIVVAHQGTEPENFLSDLNDAQFLLKGLNDTRFPNQPSNVKVHDGFQQTFERTADQVLDTVKSGLASKNTNKVLVIGHSLGAAIAIMDSMNLKANLGDASVDITTTVFGLPRGGNQEWADFVDATLGTTLVHVTNKADPVPRVPPRLFDYQHPSGEVHINGDGSVVACPGQENENCSDAALVNLNILNHLGPYFQDISMDSFACPA